ncbi:MAG: hypothetical protein QMD92_01880 [bacterium]|nr:hypothetical protein [bacterium]
MVVKKLSKKIKDITGLGNGEHHYLRAFELVKERNYKQAIISFKTASKKFKSEKNQFMDKRVLANILIYTYQDTDEKDKKVALIKDIINSLKDLEQIEGMKPPHDLVYCDEIVEELTNKRNELVATISEKAWGDQEYEQDIRIEKIERSLREVDGDKVYKIANDSIRAYLSSKDQEHQLKYCEKIIEVFKMLQPIEEIEVLERSVETERIIMEVRARQNEIQAHLEKNYIDKIKLYQSAAQIFKKIGRKELFTFKYLVYDKHVNNGEERYFFNLASALFYEAIHEAMDGLNFGSAIEKLENSANLFFRCDNEEWRIRCEKIIGSLNKKAICWVCRNEVQGQRINFNEYPITISSYFKHLSEKDHEMAASFNLKENKIVLCKVCSLLLQSMVAGQINKIIKKNLEGLEKRERDLKSYLDESIKEGKEELKKLRQEFYDIRGDVLKDLSSIENIDAEIKSLTNSDFEEVSREDIEESVDLGLESITKIDLEEVSENKGGVKKK